MLNIKVLGSGCANCNRLEKMVRNAVDQLGIEAQVEKITDPTKYLDYNVMSTPGLVINGKTFSSGRVPSLAEITSFVTTAEMESN